MGPINRDWTSVWFAVIVTNRVSAGDIFHSRIYVTFHSNGLFLKSLTEQFLGMYETVDMCSVPVSTPAFLSERGDLCASLSGPLQALEAQRRGE
jgi:hypothetical protein